MRHPLISACAAALLILCAEASIAAESRKPNIIFLLADDLGYGDTGAYGQKVIRTPAIDQLAAEGMKFTQHYAGNNVCAPSRCVLMTGKHPGHAFIRNNKEVGDWYSMRGQYPIPENEVTFTQILKKDGYATGAFGKWGLGGVGSSGDPLKHGFDHFYGYNDQRHAHNYFPQVLVSDEGLVKLDNPPMTVPTKLPPGLDANDPANYKPYIGKQYGPDLITEQALQFIREHKDKPFFLYYPTTVPHVSLQVPEDSLAEYRDKVKDAPYTGTNGYLPQRYPHATYAAMVTRMDREIGRMMKLVTELGLDENTIFIFTSDNGATFSTGGYDPEFFHSNGNLKGYKGGMYEGGIREPLMVRWKGHIKAGSVEERVTGFEDWFPTLLELAGADKPESSIDGISFAPTLLGKPQPERPFLYRESGGYGGQLCVRVGDWKLVKRNLMPGAAKKEPTTTELYNLADDPGEEKNVAQAQPEVLAKLERVMREQHVKSKDFPLGVIDNPAK